jgi:hypothetical protein
MFFSLNDFHAHFSWKDSYIMLYFVTVYFELKLYLFVKFLLCQRPVLPRSAESLREDEFEGRPSVQPSVKPNPAASTSHRKKPTHNPGANLGLIVLYFWLLVEVYLFSVYIWLSWIAQFRHDTWNPYIQKRNSSALRIPEKRRSPWWKTTSALVAIDISSLWLGDAVTRPLLDPPHIGIYWDNSARVMKHIQCFMWWWKLTWNWHGMLYNKPLLHSR